MAILKHVEIWFCKLDPKHPNSKLDKKNPTWEVQCRTDNPEQKKEWDALGFKAKLMVGKEGSENEGEPILNAAGKKQWKMNIKKRSITKTGEKASPVQVVNGALEEIDPSSIGNGSIANLRVFQYEYTKADGTKGLAPVLMAVQLKKHIVYTPKGGGDDFEMDETETIIPETNDENPATSEAEKPKVKAPSPSVKAPATADEHPEDAF